MDVRQFWFFDESDSVLFVRTDAESAQWQVDELTLTCLFPYDPGKLITRGMRIAFEDDDGVLQPFEVRKVRNYPIDEYQEITAEHIVISELTDAHTNEQELTGVTASAALSTILNAQPSGLTGAARWAVGTVTASGTSSGDIGIGSVWQNVRTIETNWNVYILPRVTFNANGITGRYLDIVPADGVWHGVRLSIDKNMDEAGVTVDDTEVKTALFGYGGNAYELTTDNLDKDKEKITLVGYTWPGKPSGASINSALGYIENTAATAMYGRNGVPRFGFYQNGDIDDQATLAQKTWEALQTTNKPTVTVDCMVRDLYRMGYHDEKIRLHDTVMIDLMPMNDILTLEIIQLSVDLLDPTATRPTIGAYVPNIIYIQRRTEERASGGAGGGISGRRGGETESEAEWSEFQAEFVVNNTIMSYHATQVDHDNKVLKAAGLDITAEGAIIYADDNINMIGSKFNVQADKIGMVVEVRDGQNVIKAAGIVSAINADRTTSTMIQGDHVTITGETGILGNLQIAGVVVADDIFSATATHNDVYCNTLTTDSNIYCDYNLVMSSTSDITTGTITANGLVECNYGLTVTGGDMTADDIFGDSLEVTGDVSAGGTVYGTTIDGDEIDAATYAGYKVNGTSIGLGDAYKTISLSGPDANHIYTLSATKFNGNTATIGTFSRATTLSGAWGSGVFTVTATPQGNELKTSLTNTGHWGNPSVTAGEDENTYYYATKATIGTSTTIYDTGNTTTINAQGRYDAGKTAGIAIGEGHFSPAGRVYTRGTSAHYFGSAGTIYEATGHIYLKLHPATEAPTGSWYSTQSSSSGATLTLYTRSSRTDLYVSGSGTPYYTSTGFSDNYYTYTG